jgi:hypothetical protein
VELRDAVGSRARQALERMEQLSAS